MNESVDNRGQNQNRNHNRGRRRRGRFHGNNNNRRRYNNDAPQLIPIEHVKIPVPEDAEITIGITGEPGAGKSALAQALGEMGAEVIDVDVAGHDVIEGPATKKKLVETFGEDILSENTTIDRARLASKAFADEDSVAKLNKIVHPRLTTKIKQVVKKAKPFRVIDAALLHELGLDELCDTTIYVTAPNDVRLERVQERGWDDEQLERREKALGEAEERRQKAALTVDNAGELSLLNAFARTILARQLGLDLAALQKEQSQGYAGNQEGGEGQEEVEEREPVTVALNDYLAKTLPELQAEADELGVRDVRWLGKDGLICEILRRVAGGRQDSIIVEGYTEFHKGQYAYVRSDKNDYLAALTDAFISGQQLRRYGLKPGMHITGTARAPRGNEKCPQILNIDTIMGEPHDQQTPYRPFEALTPLHATSRLFMERTDMPKDYSLRIIDLVAPIGKGQRGLIVAQPKCGKTVYLQKIANAIIRNNSEVELLILLIDERPEEVTDMQRSVQGGEVIASTFDQPPSRHVQAAETVINKARRMVERGKDVVILLDSITRLARAYNAEAPSSGRIMSGGLEAGALMKPKQFFGAARNIEDGGSLTILATALVDTGSVMDTVIFEEFKGTGNMELVLDRRLSNKRIFPAVDIAQSGTRKDELIIENPDELRRVWALRRFLAERSPQDAVEWLKGKLKDTSTNIEFLMTIDPDKMNG